MCVLNRKGGGLRQTRSHVLLGCRREASDCLCDSVVALHIFPPFFPPLTALFLSPSLSSRSQLTILPHLEQNQSILASLSVLLQPVQHLSTTVSCAERGAAIFCLERRVFIFLACVFSRFNRSDMLYHKHGTC